MLLRNSRALALAFGLAGLVPLARAQPQAESDSATGPVAAPKEETAPVRDEGHLRLIASPYTYHYKYAADHKPVHMIGLEWERSDGWVWGGAVFRNSYSQPSAFAYFGQRYFNFTRHDELFAQWSFGLLYGYKPPYEDKVPLNHQGFSPGAVLTLGWQFTPQLSTQLNAVGTAGIMIQFSLDFR